MAGKPKFKVGDTYGFLTIKRDTGIRIHNGCVLWECICVCGKTVVRSSESLSRAKKGFNTSCGCKYKIKEYGKKNNTKTNPILRELAIKGMKQLEGTTICQLQRTRINRNSTTGVRGVGIDARSGKYRARIMIKGKDIHIGLYDTLEEAKEARKEAEEMYHRPMIEKWEKENADN